MNHVSRGIQLSGLDRPLRTAGALFLAALGVQLLAIGAVAHLRGSADVYAYQSPDAGEYVGLARGLARYGRFVRANERGEPVWGRPDMWRTPGFPAVLALVIRVFGDSTPVLLLFQQLISAASVPLLWLILRRCSSAWVCAAGGNAPVVDGQDARRIGWAIGLTIAWCVDPFRIYYSLWLLAETLFILVLLAGIWLYSRGLARGWNARRGVLLGLLAGSIVLIRPIGILLPFLAVVGIAVRTLRRRGVRGMAPVLACALGCGVMVAPWLLRNRMVGGHWALSYQSGASLAYHKVVDVILWSEGRSAYRFDERAQDQVRSRIDARLREAWAARFGPLTPEQRESLSWRRLNFDRPVAVDPFVASQLLTHVSRDLLREHWSAAAACFAAQGLSMLVFPLGLLAAPPAGTASMPLSLLGGGGAASQVAAATIGACYLGLLTLMLWRIWTLIWSRRSAPHLYVLWPLLALFLLSVPSEDPRFRLPLIPLMLILSLPPARSRRR